MDNIDGIVKATDFITIEIDNSLTDASLDTRCKAMGDLFSILSKAVNAGYDVDMNNHRCIIIRQKSTIK